MIEDGAFIEVGGRIAGCRQQLEHLRFFVRKLEKHFCFDRPWYLVQIVPQPAVEMDFVVGQRKGDGGQHEG